LEFAPRLVAVTSHADVLPWLAPDWVVELKDEGGGMKDEGRTGRLTWRPFLQPQVRFDVRRAPQSAWASFARHHYLSGGLAASARCYEAWADGLRIGDRDGLAGASGWCGRPVAFCAVAPTLGWRGAKHISRLVVLPEFQGLGVGGRLLDAVAEMEAGPAKRVTITASHPAVVAHCSRSARWRFVAVKKIGSTRQRYGGREIRSSLGRAVAGFGFVSDGER
jgi:GNAT superfamily N-acetyltransferase